MLVHRRIALACALGALAVTPTCALARPATDPPPAEEQSAGSFAPDVHNDGDTTLALVVSGSALLIATGAAALSSHDHRRLGKAA